MRQVRETLWIGDCIDARRYADEFDYVISMMPEDDRYESSNADVNFGIPDAEHDFEIFKDACVHLREKYDEGLDILIHCQAGVSRSTSVATAMLAVKEEKDWFDVLQGTRAGHAPVSPELLRSGKQYVEVCERHE